MERKQNKHIDAPHSLSKISSYNPGCNDKLVKKNHINIGIERKELAGGSKSDRGD